MRNLAFHNDPKLQTRIIAQVEGHAAADAKYKIKQGHYYKDGKACFIGCVAHGASSSVFEKMTGFPAMLTKIGESIFENLPKDQFASFPIDVIKAPKCGANLSLLPWLFLLDAVKSAVELANTKTQEACEPALQVLRDKSIGKYVSKDVAYAASDSAGVYSTSYIVSDPITHPTSYIISDPISHATARAAFYAADAAANYPNSAFFATSYAADVYSKDRNKQRETYIHLLEKAQ